MLLQTSSQPWWGRQKGVVIPNLNPCRLSSCLPPSFKDLRFHCPPCLDLSHNFFCLSLSLFHHNLPIYHRIHSIAANNRWLFRKYFYLKGWFVSLKGRERENVHKRRRDRDFSICWFHPRMPTERLGLGQVATRSQVFHLGVPCGNHGCKHVGHPLLLYLTHRQWAALKMKQQGLKSVLIFNPGAVGCDSTLCATILRIESLQCISGWWWFSVLLLET